LRAFSPAWDQGASSKLSFVEIGAAQQRTGDAREQTIGFFHAWEHDAFSHPSFVEI